MPNGLEAKKHRFAALRSLTIEAVSSIPPRNSIFFVGRTGLEPVTDGLGSHQYSPEAIFLIWYLYEQSINTDPIREKKPVIDSGWSWPADPCPPKQHFGN